MSNLEKHGLFRLFQVKIRNDDLCHGTFLSYAVITFVSVFKEILPGETWASLRIAGIIPVSFGSLSSRYYVRGVLSPIDKLRHVAIC